MPAYAGLDNRQDHNHLAELPNANNKIGMPNITLNLRWTLVVVVLISAFLIFLSPRKIKMPRWYVVGVRLVGAYGLMFALFGFLQDSFADPAVTFRMHQLKHIFSGAMLGGIIYGLLVSGEARKSMRNAPVEQTGGICGQFPPRS